MKRVFLIAINNMSVHKKVSHSMTQVLFCKCFQTLIFFLEKNKVEEGNIW